MTERRFTTVYAAAEQIYELLAARLAGTQPGVQVEWGWPGESVGDELVWVGEVEPGDQEPGELGLGMRREAYTVAVYVDVAVPLVGAIADVARRAGELVHEVESVVHDNPTLNGALRTDGQAQIDGSPEVGATLPLASGGWQHGTRVPVGCTAVV